MGGMVLHGGESCWGLIRRGIERVGGGLRWVWGGCSGEGRGGGWCGFCRAAGLERRKGTVHRSSRVQSLLGKKICGQRGDINRPLIRMQQRGQIDPKRILE